MRFSVKFKSEPDSFLVRFKSVQFVSDGGYERGYERGYADGLAARKSEVWVFTLVDGTIVEKEVPLL